MKFIFTDELRIEDLVLYSFANNVSELILDMRNLRFIYPSALVPLSAFLHEARYKGIKIDIKWPKSNDILSYLKRMKFDEISGQKIERLQKGHPPEGRFVELTLINDRSEIDNFITNLKDVFKNEIDEPTLFRILDATSELIDNVFNHAEALWCIAMAQKYVNTIEIAISDRGIGIRESLSQNKEYEVPFDWVAVKLAVKQGITRDKTKFSGRGLSKVKNFAVKRGGHFWLWSGRGFYLAYPWTEMPGQTEGIWHGTSVGFYFRRLP